MMDLTTFPWIVADIGGTNARFSLVTDRDEQTGAYTLSQQQDFATADFATFEACFDAYLSAIGSELEGSRPEYACIAIAGPVNGDKVKFTNVNWHFSISEVQQHFALKRFEVLNDFAALACSVTHLDAEDCIEVRPGQALEKTAKAIIGPGTGLGVAALVHGGQGWAPLASEGGHRGFAPQTEREIGVLNVLQAERGYVCAENLLSGAGLVNIYSALAQLDGKPCGELHPSEITERVLSADAAHLNEKVDAELARETLEVFCAVLGSVVGDTALTYGAKGGVYLGGGILPRMPKLLLNSEFLARFENKGVMSHYLQDIPIQLIVHKNPALIGAAAWLETCIEAAA